MWGPASIQVSLSSVGCPQFLGQNWLRHMNLSSVKSKIHKRRLILIWIVTVSLCPVRARFHPPVKAPVILLSTSAQRILPLSYFVGSISLSKHSLNSPEETEATSQVLCSRMSHPVLRTPGKLLSLYLLHTNQDILWQRKLPVRSCSVKWNWASCWCFLC